MPRFERSSCECHNVPFPLHPPAAPRRGRMWRCCFGRLPESDGGEPSCRLARRHETAIRVDRRRTFRAFGAALEQIYDFRRMIEVATGSHWASADETMRSQLTEAFARFSTLNYATRFAGYAGETFTVTGESPGLRSTKIVSTVIDRGKEAKLAAGDAQTVSINYVLAEIDGGWRIIDVLLNESISELAVRRSEYSRILRDGGPERLITVLNTKSDELLSQP